MNIKFLINKTYYILTSDKRNWILYPVTKPRDKTFFSTIGGLLEDLYQTEIKSSNVKSFKELIKHSESIKQQITGIEKRFSLGIAKR